MSRLFPALVLVLTTTAAVQAGSLVVPFGDLDPASPAGLAALQARIRAAAETVCIKAESQDRGTGYMDTLRERRDCIAQASSRAMARAQSLIARRNGRTGNAPKPRI